jgi:hypothetical protein
MKDKELLIEVMKEIQGRIDSACASQTKYDDWINGNVFGLYEAVEIIKESLEENVQKLKQRKAGVK